jgi:dihydroorotase
MRLIELMSTRPAQIVGLDKTGKGTLREGADADVTIIDPEAVWTIDAEEFRSKSRNCPFHGWKVKGRAVMTIVGGDVKWEAGAG